MTPSIPRARRAALVPWLAVMVVLTGGRPASAAGADAPAGAPEKSPPAAASTPSAAPPAGTPDAPAPGGTAEPPPEVLKQIERDKATDEKAQTLRAAAQAHPNEVSYQVAYAQGLLDLGRTDEALGVCPIMIEKFPRSAELMTSYGRALARDGQFELASLQYQRALGIDAKSAKTHALGAGVSLIRGDLKPAAAGYR